MVMHEPEFFDDPSLKQAVRQAWGSERAPEALRRRLSELLADERGGMRIAARPAARYPRWWQGRFNPLYGLAAAAIVLLGFGISYHYFSPPSSNPVGPQFVASGSSLPVTLADNLVSRHDTCCRADDHHGIPSDDFRQIARELERQLNIRVLASPLDPSWTFHGASVCPVGAVNSGHLVFARDKQFVSLFSLPASVLNNAHLKPVSEMDQNHPIAAFETGNGVYCVVGSSADGSLTLQQVQFLRDKVQPSLAANEDDSQGAVAQSR